MFVFLFLFFLLNHGETYSSKREDKENQMREWCLMTNDAYSRAKPSLAMGVRWGTLPPQDRKKWERFDCNNRTPWERSTENKRQWCDLVRTGLRGSMSGAVKTKARIFGCKDFGVKSKASFPPPVAYDISSGNAQTDCMHVHGVKECGRIISVHWHGRFGNRVFQYAFLCEAARRYAPSIVYLVSNWEGTVLFDITQCPVLVLPNALSDPFSEIYSTVKGSRNDKQRRVAKLFETYVNSNPSFGSAPIQWNDMAKTEPSKNRQGHVNVWLDSLQMMYLESIFKKMDRGNIMRMLRFSDHVRESKIFKLLSPIARTYDLAQLRRDDVLNVQKPDGTCGSYCVISMQSYENALSDRDIQSKDVVWVSDDPKLRTRQSWHSDLDRVLRSLENKYWQYPTGERYVPDYMYNFFPDLLLMVFSRRFFRAGSSFGFWGGFLNQINPGCSYVYSVDMHQCDRGELVRREGRNRNKKAYEYHCPFVASNSNHWVLRGKERVPYDEVTWA